MLQGLACTGIVSAPEAGAAEGGWAGPWASGLFGTAGSTVDFVAAAAAA